MALTTSVADLCRQAKAAARELAQLGSGVRDAALLGVADAPVERTAEILEANARDLEAGRESGLSDALMDRLPLHERRGAAVAAGGRGIGPLPDPGGGGI